MDSPDASKVLYMQNLFVSPQHRGQGIGTELLNFTFQKAVDEGYDGVSLDLSFHNPKAKKLYEKLGCQETNRKTFPFTNQGMWRIVRHAS